MASPEGWLSQHRKVRGIAQRAAAHRRVAARLRRSMRARIARFGEPRLAAWAFLAGLVWASGGSRASRGPAGGRTLAGVAASLLWAWNFAHRVRAAGVALGLDAGPAAPQPAVGVRRRGGDGHG
jgi:hypothetical protein